jgi:opacity protein-like surface antigen
MKRNQILVSSAIALALALPLTASAADSGFYIGGFVGRGSVDIPTSDWDATATDLLSTVTSSHLDKSDTTFGAVLGYQFMRYVAIEASYIDFGKAKGDATGTALIADTSVPATLHGEFKSRGPALAVVGILPFGENWAVDGRAGIYYGKSEITLTGFADNGAGITGTLGPLTDSQSRSSFMAGIGGAYSFTENFSVRLDYLYFNKVGLDTSNVTEKADINAFTLGLRYKF